MCDEKKQRVEVDKKRQRYDEKKIYKKKTRKKDNFALGDAEIQRGK